MHLKYTHYFGNESSEELLESYGVETNKDKKQLLADALRPKQCPNCSESNIPNAKFRAKCRMVLTYDAYSETLENEKEKENKLATMEKQFGSMQSQIQSLIMAFANMKEQTQFDSMAKTLYDSHILGKDATTATTSITTPTNSLEEEKVEDQQHNQQQQQQKQKRIQKQLIKAAGRAAFLATTRKRRGRRSSFAKELVFCLVDIYEKF